MVKSIFEKKYIDYLTVYKIPIGPDQLDPTVFYFSETGEPPKLQPAIHAQITSDLEQFTSNQPQRVKGYYLVGDAVTPGSKHRKGDLRVLICLNKDLMDVDIDGLLAEELMKLANNLSGRLATGTSRKIVYIPTLRKPESADYKGIYDIPMFKWIKTPNGLTQ